MFQSKQLRNFVKYREIVDKSNILLKISVYKPVDNLGIIFFLHE